MQAAMHAHLSAASVRVFSAAIDKPLIATQIGTQQSILDSPP